MRKNVASQTIAFQMTLATDGTTAVTSGTPTVYYTVDGGTQGTGAGTSTHEGNGQWSYVPAQAETNGDHVIFTMVLATAITQAVNVYPVAYDPTSAALGLNNVAVTDIVSSGAITTAGGAVSTVTTLTGHTAQSGDTYALANGAAGFVAIDTVVDSILVDTAEIGAAGAGLTVLATAANLATVAGYLDTEIAAILVDTGTSIPALIATAQADLDTITGADGVNLLSATQATLDDVPTTAEFEARTLVAASYFDPAADTVANVTTVATTTTNTDMLTAAAILTTQMTEAYAADGVAPTLAQSLFLVQQALTEVSISSVTETIKKLDGSTVAATITLDSASAPTSKTRAT